MVAPVILAALTPFVKDLFSNGLSMLGNAIMSKGKAKVEEVLGITLPPEGKPLTSEQLASMRGLEMTHEEVLLELAVRQQELSLEAEKVATVAVTKRWEADMLSDSWLSKNVRPLALLHMLAALDVMLVCALFGALVPDTYLTLVGTLLTTMVGAYFIGRTVEKGVDVYQGWKQTKGE